MNPGEQPFITQEAILALCLILAGGEPYKESQPCINLFDAEILSKLGYRGLPVGEAAQEAWKAQQKGHVEYLLKMTPRLADLIRAYREQCRDLANFDLKTGDLILKIHAHANAGAILLDEMVLRIACVILKTRGDFMNLWKQMIPLLRVPVSGKSKHFDSTMISKGKMIEAKGVHKPGFKVISLNATENVKKHVGL